MHSAHARLGARSRPPLPSEPPPGWGRQHPFGQRTGFLNGTSHYLGRASFSLCLVQKHWVLLTGFVRQGRERKAHGLVVPALDLAGTIGA